MKGIISGTPVVVNRTKGNLVAGARGFVVGDNGTEYQVQSSEPQKWPCFPMRTWLPHDAVEPQDLKVGRALLVKSARDLQTEINAHFTALDHWNRQVRTADEAPIDADPDGRLGRILDGLNKMLATEDGREVTAPQSLPEVP